MAAQDNSPDTSDGDQPEWRRYAEAEAARLGFRLVESDGRFVIEHDDAEDAGPRAAGRRRWGGGLKTRVKKAKVAEPTATADLETDSPRELLDWIADRQAADAHLARYTPVGEPHSVHELTDKLFPAYTINGGAIHLGGCHLEEVPFLRLTGVDSTGQTPCFIHRFFDASGAAVAPALVAELRLNDTQPATDSRPHESRERWSAAMDAAGESASGDWRLATIVVAARAAGHLEVTIGEESLSVPFKGWTRTLAAPPAVCPESGAETFHLAALGDGRIAAREAIVTCDESRQAILRAESETCSVTGKTVAKEFCLPCPATGKPTLERGLVTCRRCGQQVSRGAITPSGCTACGQLAALGVDDPRLRVALAAAPKLAGEKRLWFGESQTATFIEARGLWRRTLVVIDKATGTIAHAAQRPRLSTSWRKLTDAERREALGA